ncbi:MAG: acyl-CoA dehydrogenase [Alphaproteobacteria bacterium]
MSAAADFAREHIAGRDWHAHDVIPAELWRALADAGLLGLEGGWRDLSHACRDLAEAGGNQGIAMSVMAHNLVPRLHLRRLGTQTQQDRLLPGLARGEHGMAVAISEPGAGAHPKLLKTRAVHDGDGWRLDGEKAYVSNGPLADHAIVLAITDEVDGRKQFTGFLVPLDTAGVSRTAGVHIDFLRPMPHCGLKLDNVHLPADAIIGPEGDAFAAISLPMRRVEDAVGLGTTVGALRHELALVAQGLGDNSSDDDRARLGQLLETVDALAVLADTAAERLDAHGIDTPGLEALADAGKSLAKQVQDSLTGWPAKWDNAAPPDLARVAHDLDKSLNIAGAAYRARRMKAADAWLKRQQR